MKMRKLGKSGVLISVMGYGCGGYWGYETFDEKQAARLVHMAIEGGVTFLDTGASYSGGNAEIRLGKILKGVDKTKLVIGTKSGTVIHNGRLHKDYSQASIFFQAHTSLKRLGLERLPLLQLHGVPEDGLEDALDALDTLKQQGKVNLIGASCDGPALEHMLSLNRLDVVMLTYNLLEKHAIRQVDMAYNQGCGVLVKSPLAHTLYCTDIFKIKKPSDIWYLARVLKNYRGLLREGRKYRFINHIDGWTSHEIALGYALSDQVTCIVTGSINEHHLQHNLAALEKDLPAELRARIDAV